MWRKDRADEDGSRVPTLEAGVGTDKEGRGVNQAGPRPQAEGEGSEES